MVNKKKHLKKGNGGGSRVTEITAMETMEAKCYKRNKGIVKEVEDDKTEERKIKK